ncbi:MAG: aryl-sulfate sulfotransferase [Myxococcota bacterium]
MWTWLACTADPPSPVDPPPIDSASSAPLALVGPSFTAAPSPYVRQVHHLRATTSVPTRLSVTLDGARRITFDALDTDHDVPLYGLRANTVATGVATFTAADGAAVEAPFSLPIGPSFELLPTVELVSSDPARSEGGYTLFPLTTADEERVYAVDAAGELVWAWDAEGDVKALQWVDGELAALFEGSALRFSPDGPMTRLWTENVDGASSFFPDATPIPVELHHEVAAAADGTFWALAKTQRAVDAYPTSELDPTVTAPTTIDDDHVVHFAADGSVLSDWSMADRLDPTRIGFGSLDWNTADGAYDWAHANAITPRPDGGVWVSLRHQDAVVALSAAGEPEWILGNPDGWREPWASLLLTPVGTPFEWQYHQHAPALRADGAMVLFDNGNDWRTTPYSQAPDPRPLHSRLVAYEVDPVARTVRQLWESPGDPLTLYAQALGNADPLPRTGNVLGTFPYLHDEGGVDNIELGRGDRTVRLIEVAPDGAVVWDLRLSVPVSLDDKGVLVDRAIRIPSLYGPGVTEEAL